MAMVLRMYWGRKEGITAKGEVGKGQVADSEAEKSGFQNQCEYLNLLVVFLI